MKQLAKMQKKIQELRHELDNAIFEVSSCDCLVKIIMSGAQQVKGVDIQGDIEKIEKANLERAIKDAYNRAIKHSHDLAAEKMKVITGFNLPGLI